MACETLWDCLAAPLSFGFMQRGLAAAVMIAIVCAVIGAFVVMQELAFIGDALAQEPDALLLDEPLSGVDAPTQEAILAILSGLAAQGKTLLITTHDLRCNMEHFDALLALNRRVIALGPVAQVLTPGVLTRTYGAQMVLADGTSVALT